MSAEPTERAKLLRSVSPDDIEQQYRRGYITAGDKNKLLREKAHDTVAGLLEDGGYFKAIFDRTVTHLQKGWDNIKEATVREPTNKVSTELYYAGLAFWGQVQILTSVVNAWGEVNGQVAENWALKAGASPGLARVINIGTDVATGFVPIGGVAKSFAKTVQKVGKKSAEKAAAKVAQEGGEAVAKAAQIDASELHAAKAIVKGLAADGVDDAAKIMGKSADDAGRSITAALDDAVEGIVKPAKSVSEQFADDLATFKSKMDRITKVQAHEETAAMAERLGLSLDDLKHISPGTALNEKEMYAYLKALEPQVQKLQALADDVVNTGSQESVEALAKHASEFFTVAPVFRGAEVTAGRSVEILKEVPPMKKLTDLLTHWDPEKIAKGNFTGAMKTFADDLVALRDDPDKLMALAATNQSGFAKFGEVWWPRMREGYINLLLSRPLTQVRNAIGNSVAATNAVLDRFAGSTFRLGTDAGLARGESWYLAKGMMHGTRDGLHAFADAFKHVDPSDASKLDYIPHQIPGKLGRIINIPGDTLRGMDNFFKTALRRASYYAEALRDGTHLGKTGSELADFVARRVNNPTQKMLAHADDFATYNTFQSELGRLGKAAQNLQHGPLALWFPFMKTPINLAKYAWNRTPGLQLLSKSLYDDILAGGARADLAIGRLTMSNLQAHFLFNLAQEGYLTGSGPADPGLKESWMAEHQPYSVRGKDGWYPIANMEPGSTAVGLVGDYAQVMNQLDEPTAAQGAMAVSFALMHNLADKTYWQTFGRLIDITSGIAKGERVGTMATKTALYPLTTIATVGPLVAATARIIDPVLRETRTFVDMVTAKVPGYSNTLPPNRDAYGDPILPPQTIGASWLSYVSPFTYKPNTTDRVKLEGSKLHARLPQFPWSISGSAPDDFDIREPQPGERYGIALSPQQRDRWQVIYKNMLRHKELGIENVLFANTEYQKGTSVLQREMFEGYLRDAKKTALDLLLAEDTTLGKQVIDAQVATQLPLLNMRQQDETRQQVDRAKTLYDTLTHEQLRNLSRYGLLNEDTPEPVAP